MFGSTSPKEEQVEATQAKAEMNSKQTVGWVLEVKWPRSKHNVPTQKPGQRESCSQFSSSTSLPDLRKEEANIRRGSNLTAIENLQTNTELYMESVLETAWKCWHEDRKDTYLPAVYCTQSICPKFVRTPDTGFSKVILALALAGSPVHCKSKDVRKWPLQKAFWMEDLAGSHMSAGWRHGRTVNKICGPLPWKAPRVGKESSTGCGRTEEHQVLS